VSMNEGKPPLTLKRRVENAWLRLKRERRIYSVSQQVKAHAKPNTGSKHVVVFNASTRLTGFSQNAAFSLLTTWGLQLSGIKVTHFTCRAGMERCVLGTNPDDSSEPPPCEGCINLSKRILRSTEVSWFEYEKDQELSEALNGLSVEELSRRMSPQGKSLKPIFNPLPTWRRSFLDSWMIQKHRW